MDGAVVGHDIAGDEPQRRGLAASAGAKQRNELIVLDLEIEVRHRRDIGVARAEMLRQPFDRDACHYPIAPWRPRAPTSPPPTLLAMKMAMPMITMLTMASAATGSV